jgi:hypothetical protein
MRTKKYSLFLLIICTISCNTKTRNCQTLDFGAFKLKAPKGWVKFKEQGIDSYVGGLTNGKDSLWFDYGWYSSEINDEYSSSHLYGQDTINGLIATIQIPKVDGKGFIRLNISHVNDKDRFNLGGYNIRGTEIILRIFKSVTFKESDTNQNGILDISKFRNYPLASGRTLYYFNCVSCHHRFKDATGPALTNDLLNSRNNDWLMLFFTNRNAVKTDSAYQSRKKEFSNLECIELTQYSKEEVESLISYIKGK